jgi:hypothetical protein
MHGRKNDTFSLENLMDRNNIGDWHVDRKILLKYRVLTCPLG